MISGIVIAIIVVGVFFLFAHLTYEAGYEQGYREGREARNETVR
jgi:hypothetical protein